MVLAAPIATAAPSSHPTLVPMRGAVTVGTNSVAVGIEVRDRRVPLSRGGMGGAGSVGRVSMTERDSARTMRSVRLGRDVATVQQRNEARPRWAPPVVKPVPGEQRGPHGLRAPPPARHVERQRAVDDLRDGARDPGCHGRQRSAGVHRGPEHHPLCRLPFVHRAPADQREERGARGPHVRPRVHVGHPRRGLLGSHVRGGPDDRRRPCQRQIGGERFAHPCDAEVQHLQLAVRRDKEVRRLHVAVDDPLRVSRGEHVEELLHDRDASVQPDAARLGVAKVLDRGPLDAIHHEERRPVLGDVVVHDLHDVPVLHPVRHVRLAEEALADDGILVERAVEDLDRELGVVPVRSGVDRRHPPHAQDRVEPVLPAQDHPDARFCVRHEVRVVEHCDHLAPGR